MKAGVSTLELNWEVDQRSLLQLIQLILLFAENSCAFSSVCMMKKKMKITTGYKYKSASTDASDY